jgi:hypothetical protein
MDGLRVGGMTTQTPRQMMAELINVDVGKYMRKDYG